MKRRRVFDLALLVLLMLALVPLVAADTLVRGFGAKGTVQPGMIVSLLKNSSNTVQADAGNDDTHIYGVAIDPSLAPLTVQQEGQQVFVATAGNYPILVSTQNGTIKAGDYISISSTTGIGDKAVNQTFVVGRALEGFDGKNGVITTSGEQAIGRISVAVALGQNPLSKNIVAIPAPLKRIGQNIAGKNVTAARIYLALLVLVVSAIIAISVLVVGIRSSMIAIGRNPLSNKVILKGLLQVVIVSVLVLMVGMSGVYLLLKA